MLNVLFDEKRTIIGGGGDYFRSNFNYRNIWDNLVREAIVFVKGRFPGILIILHVRISGFVAASCCFSFRVGAYNYTAYQSVVPLSTKCFVNVLSNDP